MTFATYDTRAARYLRRLETLAREKVEADGYEELWLAGYLVGLGEARAAFQAIMGNRKKKRVESFR